MYNTGNEVPSSALEDMADNAQTFDALVTQTEGTTTDRLGNTRRVFQQILMDMGFQPLAGSFQTGAKITARNQTLYDEVSHVFYAWGGVIPVGGYIIPAGSTPETAGGVSVGAWTDKTDLTLRGNLLLPSGADFIGFSQSEIYDYGTAGEKLKQIVSITDAPFNAVSGTDSTAAIDAAAAAAQYVFVPEGQFISTNAALAYWKFFGFGSLRVGNTLVELSAYPQNGNTGKFYKERTFGNRENACAISIVANGTAGQAKENTSITGATTDYIASTYQSFDHVAEYVAAHNFSAVTTTAASTAYTSTSVTAPEISTASVKVGMYLYTQHPTGFVGKVTSVSGNTAVVDGWYLWGTGAAGTPANASSVKLNPNTKVWSKNINLFLDSSGDATAGAGIELGLIINKTGAGANTWGYDCITLGSSETPYAHFISRGAKTHGFLSLTNGAYGFASDTNQVGFEARGSTLAMFRALVSGSSKWTINSSGALERDYRKFKATNAATYAIATDDCFVVNVYGSATLTLPSPATVGANRVYTVKANAVCTVATASGVIDGASTKPMASGSYNRFISDGTNWYAF